MFYAVPLMRRFLLPDKCIVLDRDGVVNEDSNAYIKSADEWQPIPGSVGAIAQLKKAGYKVFIVTNQSGLARGCFSEADLNAMHQKLAGLLAEYNCSVDGIEFCPHLPTANCSCRKPGTGMLEAIEKKYSVKLSGCFFVGDSLKDLQAGEAFAMQPVLVKTGKGAATLQKNIPAGTRVFASLLQVVESLALN
jgi:D-glycero-D-manno-heptose 1,7-bisphosphate phosphatase